MFNDLAFILMAYLCCLEMRILAQVFILFISIVLLSSCYADPDCISLRNDILGITFKKIGTGEEDVVEINSITMSGSDSVFNAATASSKVYLPLNVNQSEQTIEFNLAKGAFTMVVGYLSQPQFEAVECGPRFVMTDINVIEHTFDSVKVTGSVPLLTSAGTNIIIYSN